MRRRLRFRVGSWALAICLLSGVLTPAVAQGFEIEPGSFSVIPSTLEAGAHPDLTTSFAFTVGGDGTTEGNARNVEVDLPVGFSGALTDIPRCRPVELMTKVCPVSSQVGVLHAELDLIGFPFEFVLPVYNMVPEPGQTAGFAFELGGQVTNVITSVRAGDYGLRENVTNLTGVVEVVSTELTIWGVPASSTHDAEREGQAAGVAPRPLLRNPTHCTSEPLVATMRAETWGEPNHQFEASTELGPITGCEGLQLHPTFSLQPDVPRAGAPSGYTAHLTIPQNEEDPEGRATSDLRKATVVLPRGLALSPSAADGLQDCTDTQVGLGNSEPVRCPEASKVGTAISNTPALPNPLTGAIYLAGPSSGPITGPPYRLFLVLEGEGVVVKLVGEVAADLASGRLTMTFDENPQLPFSDLELRFKGGPRASLENPDSCGSYGVAYEFTPWSGGPSATGTTQFSVDQACDTGGFDPGFAAGTTSPVAGSPSPFALDVTRADGEQNISSIGVTLPEGLLAKLAGVPLCPGSEVLSGACPATSQVGSVKVAVGAGTLPFWMSQAGKAPTAIYLSGPYKGAPYSLVIVVPAQAGPFDLGTVVTRAAIEIEPETAQATVVADPLPQILGGVPLHYRHLHVDVDRPHFTRNPTDCEPMSVASQIVSSAGVVARPGSRFQVGGCGELPFRPKLSIGLTGPTHRGAHPALHTTLTMRRGSANIGRAAVSLPHSEFLDQAHIRTVCTRAQFAAASCPAASIYGFATARTPLLDKPLRGPVYLRSSSHELPDLVADLHGQVHIVLDGRIDSVHGGIRTTFEAVPDAPVSKFTLTMKGGKRGLLQNSTNICGKPQRATAKFRGQNGKVQELRPSVGNDCHKPKSKRHRRS